MPRIAIVGSCITRDLWPIHGGGAERLHYVSRTSLPSLLSQPMKDFVASDGPPGDLHASEHRALVADLRKTSLAALIAYRPTHLIFDFIDERFDLVSVGGSLATRSAELLRSGYLAQPALQTARVVPRLSAACDRLWLEAAGEFAALVRATSLRNARLILHSARWASEQRAPDGRLSPIQNVDIVSGQHAEIAAYNQLLARQEAAFEAMMPPMERVDAGHLRMADSVHRWGLSPFHYVPEYYDEVRRQLASLGLERAFSARPAAPSAPAA